jgi:UDP-glucose 4-epimerase
MRGDTMKILVTGGCGFIGSHVVDAWVEGGHHVAIIDNLSTGERKNANAKATLYAEDICSSHMAAIFEREKPDIVSHLAAQISVPLSVKEPLVDAEVNVKGTINLLELSKNHGIKKFIFSSTGGAVYGEAEQVPTDETCCPEPASPYAVSKFAGEKYLRYYNGQFGLPYVILRYSNVYGPRQTPHGEAGVVAIFIKKFLAGTRPILNHFPEEGRGMIRDYCYVKDIARANLLAASAEGVGTFNVGTGRGTYTIDLYREILNTLRKKGRDIAGNLEGPLQAGARPGDIRVSILNAGKAERELGWAASCLLEDGLLETVEWYLRNEG